MLCYAMLISDISDVLLSLANLQRSITHKRVTMLIHDERMTVGNGATGNSRFER